LSNDDTAVWWGFLGPKGAFEQRRADPVALPSLLNAEGRLGLAPENAQIGDAAQHAVHEEPVKDHIAAACRCGIASDCIVADPATEPIASAFSVEPKQVVAIGVRLDAPELPDQAAFDKDLLHRGSPLRCSALAVSLKRIPLVQTPCIRFSGLCNAAFNDSQEDHKTKCAAIARFSGIHLTFRKYVAGHENARQ
jgi:hypothetical protein